MKILITLCSLSLIISFSFCGSPSFGCDDLASLERKISKKFTIDEITPSSLQIKREGTDRQQFVIFDVRKEDEFAVSHLDGAFLVDPDMPTTEFITHFGHLVAGKNVVFYCSVGYRSSDFALRVQKRVRKAGGQSILNLQGGIFRWFNESRPLVDNLARPVDAVHPYDATWGRYVCRTPGTATDKGEQKGKVSSPDHSLHE